MSVVRLVAFSLILVFCGIVIVESSFFENVVFLYLLHWSCGGPGYIWEPGGIDFFSECALEQYFYFGRDVTVFLELAAISIVAAVLTVASRLATEPPFRFSLQFAILGGAVLALLYDHRSLYWPLAAAAAVLAAGAFGIVRAKWFESRSRA